MSEVFHGWRRAFGIVTLVISLVIMGGWVRSHLKRDVVVFVFESGEATIFNFSSDQYGLGWVRVNSSCNSPPFSTKWISSPIDGSRPADPLKETTWLSPTMVGSKLVVEENQLLRSNLLCRWDCGGVHFGSKNAKPALANLTAFYVPYWSITVPLTLISAFLLLSKPRQSTRKKITEPDLAERG